MAEKVNLSTNGESLSLLVHGISVNLTSGCGTVLEDFAHDFAYFLTKRNPESLVQQCNIRSLNIEHHYQVPPSRKSIPQKKRSHRYWTLGNRSRVSFFGNVFVDYDFGKNTCLIHSQNSVEAYEAIYFVVLSYLGESLDKMGLHRIHGFGFVSQGTGGILLAPSGGGKSTLSLELMKRAGLNILSDDTPVLAKDGTMLAFPQRIAVKAKPDLPEVYLRKFKRVKYGEKYVIGADYFGQYICSAAKVDYLLIAGLEKRDKASIKRVSRFHLIWPLLKWLVIGFETPQIWELYLRLSVKDIVSKAGIFFSRLRTALIYFSKAKVAKFYFSKNVVDSADVFEAFFLNNQKLSEKKTGVQWNFRYT